MGLDLDLEIPCSSLSVIKAQLFKSDLDEILYHFELLFKIGPWRLASNCAAVTVVGT